MKGKLFGIGTGPGDVELITLKAIRTIGNCDIIAVPSAGESDRTAYYIAEEYLKGKELLECGFSMDKDITKRRECREQVASDICRRLDEGKNVGFITLGDPSVYSTYMYVHKIVDARGYETEIIPGVTSFSAAAAAMNTSLCEGGEPLIIIPGADDLDELMNFPGNKVIMKSGSGMSRVTEILKKRGLSHNTKVVERCGMDGQRIYSSLDELNGDTNYFSVMLVREGRNASE